MLPFDVNRSMVFVCIADNSYKVGSYVVAEFIGSSRNSICNICGMNVFTVCCPIFGTVINFAGGIAGIFHGEGCDVFGSGPIILTNSFGIMFCNPCADITVAVFKAYGNINKESVFTVTINFSNGDAFSVKRFVPDFLFAFNITNNFNFEFTKMVAHLGCFGFCLAIYMNFKRFTGKGIPFFSIFVPDKFGVNTVIFITGKRCTFYNFVLDSVAGIVKSESYIVSSDGINANADGPFTKFFIEYRFRTLGIYDICSRICPTVGFCGMSGFGIANDSDKFRGYVAAVVSRKFRNKGSYISCFKSNNNTFCGRTAKVCIIFKFNSIIFAVTVNHACFTGILSGITINTPCVYVFNAHVCCIDKCHFSSGFVGGAEYDIIAISDSSVAVNFTAGYFKVECCSTPKKNTAAASGIGISTVCSVSGNFTAVDFERISGNCTTVFSGISIDFTTVDDNLCACNNAIDCTTGRSCSVSGKVTAINSNGISGFHSGSIDCTAGSCFTAGNSTGFFFAGVFNNYIDFIGDVGQSLNRDNTCSAVAGYSITCKVKSKSHSSIGSGPVNFYVFVNVCEKNYFFSVSIAFKYFNCCVDCCLKSFILCAGAFEFCNSRFFAGNFIFRIINIPEFVFLVPDESLYIRFGKFINESVVNTTIFVNLFKNTFGQCFNLNSNVTCPLAFIVFIRLACCAIIIIPRPTEAMRILLGINASQIDNIGAACHSGLFRSFFTGDIKYLTFIYVIPFFCFFVPF